MANGGTVLVTGAAGNVGSGLVPALRAAGIDVRALVHSEDKASALRGQGVNAIVADMERPETLRDAVRETDKVYLLSDNGPQGALKAKNVIDGRQGRRLTPYRPAGRLRNTEEPHRPAAHPGRGLPKVLGPPLHAPEAHLFHAGHPDDGRAHRGL